MKMNLRNLLPLPVLIVSLGLVLESRTIAQTFTTLHSFTATISTGPPNYSYTNSDGASPNDLGGLILSGNTLYGTAAGGGSSGIGTVFALNINGAGFTNLHSFTAHGAGGTTSVAAYPYA